MRRTRVPRAAAIASLLGGCIVTPSDLGQYTQMQGEAAGARAHEAVHCTARDLTCARLVQMRGEACAQLANDRQQSDRHGLRQCALDSAGLMRDVLPADAPDADRDRAQFLVFDAWRVALDGSDPAASPASVQAAAAWLAGMTGGAPYAATLQAYAATFLVLEGRVPANTACANLAAAAQMLPATAPPLLTGQVAMLRTAITASRSNRSCP